jgi:hypothetical protein
LADIGVTGRIILKSLPNNRIKDCVQTSQDIAESMEFVKIVIKLFKFQRRRKLDVFDELCIEPKITSCHEAD